MPKASPKISKKTAQDPDVQDDSQVGAADDQTTDTADDKQTTDVDNADEGDTDDAAADQDAPKPFSLRDTLASQGYDVSDYESDADAAADLLRSAEAFEKNQAYFELGQQIAPHYSDYQRYLMEQEAAKKDRATEPPKQTPTPVEKTSEKPVALEWDVPEYDPAWGRFCEFDEKGRAKAVVGDPAIVQYAQKVNAYQDWQQRAGDRIVREFPQLVQQAMAQEIAGLREEIQGFRQAAQQERDQSEVQAWMEGHAADFFEHDKDGNLLVDAAGRQIPTPRYEAAVEYYQQLAQSNLDERVMRQMIDVYLERDELAGRFGDVPAGSRAPKRNPRSAIGADANQTRSAASRPTRQSPTDVGKAKKHGFLRRVVEQKGAQTTNRGGTRPRELSSDDAPQSPDETLDDIVKQEMDKRGISYPKDVF